MPWLRCDAVRDGCASPALLLQARGPELPSQPQDAAQAGIGKVDKPPQDGRRQSHLGRDARACVDEHEGAFRQEQAVDGDGQQRHQRDQGSAQHHRQHADVRSGRPQHAVLGEHHRAVERERVEERSPDRRRAAIPAEHAYRYPMGKGERRPGKARQVGLDDLQQAQEAGGHEEDHGDRHRQGRHPGDGHEAWNRAAQIQGQDQQADRAQAEHHQQTGEALDQDRGRHPARPSGAGVIISLTASPPMPVGMKLLKKAPIQ